MSTNITAAHRRDFQAFTSGKYGNFAHFPFFIYGSPEAANVAVNQRPSTEEGGGPISWSEPSWSASPRPRRHQGMSRDVSFRHRPDIAVPVECRAMIRDGALVAVNHSGGKDSQAMTILLSAVVPHDQLLVVHAPLGEVEWPGTVDHTEAKPSRLDQIVAWLAGSLDEDDRHAFDGAILFDEAHAMANAAGSKSNRGEVAPSQQGRAGLRLQHALPDARIAYVSATGATTIPGLAYAGRLGLWAAGETPFETRTEFVSAMEAGGVAALEVVARDLKALGLYQARALSYDGVEVEILEHPLTDAQRRIYDAYAGAFKVIHHNIEEALKATGIVDGESTLNKNAKSAAMSAFEGAKQRFFGHLLTSMKCPSLIRAIEADLDAGRSAVVQLVSTGEALMERRIAEIPASEWDDINVDLTPRETVIEFLAHAFPVQLQEPFTDDEGNVMSRPVFDDDGNPVICQEAAARRDALIEKLASLPPVPAALDQIVQHFGHEAVAEVTGRSRRVLKVTDATGRTSGAPQPAGLCQPRRDRRLHGPHQAHPRVLDGGGHRPELPRRSVLRQHRAAHPLPAGAGMAGRPGHPGPWPHPPHAPGLGAAVPSRDHRCEGGEEIHRHDRAQAGLARRHHARAARLADRDGRGCHAVPRERQPGEPVCEGGAAPVLRRALARAYPGLVRRPLREGHRPQARTRRQPQRGIAADAPVPEPAAGPSHRRAERALRPARGAHRRQHRAGRRGRHLSCRGRDRARRFALHRRARDHLRASRHRGGHRAGRDPAPRPPGADHGRGRRFDIGERDPGPDGKPVLMVNARSKRAAVALPAPSRMFDDGGVQERVRLVRPAVRESMARAELDASNWRRADESTWRTLWEAEIASLPTHRDSRFWLAAGLLLPIWDRLPAENMRVRRLTTDAGEALIGRVLDAEQVRAVRTSFGLDGGFAMTGSEAFEAVMGRGTALALANGWRLARRRIMGADRVEIEGPADGDTGALKRMGCTVEIVSWRARAFAPGAQVLERILERWPLGT